jgi:ligand-binding sensor protein
MPEKNFSTEAQWFLKNLQKLQDDFAESVGGQIVTTDKEGNLLTKMSGAQRVCKLIMETEQGKAKCSEAYKTALSLVKTMKEPAFMDCHAGYASLWMPIKINGKIVGSITGCGGKYDRGESKEELREKFSKLADDLGISDKEDFLKAGVDEIDPVSEKEMKDRATKLAKLVVTLAEEDVLKEVFGE